MFVRYHICYVRATEESKREYFDYITNISLVTYPTDSIFGIEAESLVRLKHL